MAFDQTTRGRLQKLVNACRSLLSDEFSVQLQQTYGLDPNTGEVTPMARLTHLDDRQRHTAEVLRQTMTHYLGAESDTQDHRLAVMNRMVREQAFTVLNRMAALLMMEARGQLFESVSKGYQSRGYQLYSKIAGTALGETGPAYQAYLHSVFDDLALELPALFDRYASNGLLFPRETTLRSLLQELNHFEIEQLWGEDETIGWIYQYFNSKEERKAMRDASQAPRNSRELAVRNQFFTPRYVVEFLVDNTLGRLWFNATGGKTTLRERCQYLLVKPDEQPQAAIELRDPRTLKLLDPACGSMHFGLYAFDLFVEIYREAWIWEQQHGPGSLDVSTHPQAALKPLCQTFEDEAVFARAVPRLIIENNIYGVDIDPRAAQIATLALWLRAQRAWHDAGVKAKDRPYIGQGHVVAAIAPPAERELHLQFAADLDQRDAELFEKTLQMLKGLPELGVLLQVEHELPKLIRQVYASKGTGLFAAEEQEGWERAEARLCAALTEFSQPAKSTYQGHLFAQDALQGLRLIDLCREVFDVVVMNPPYGDGSVSARDYLQANYGGQPNDLFGCFIERSIQMGRYIGALTSRTFLFFSSFEKLRVDYLFPKKRISTVADLGFGVLDGAMVETCAMVLEPKSKVCPDSIFIRLNESDEKAETLARVSASFRENRVPSYVYLVPQEVFERIDGAPMPYWVGNSILNRIHNDSSIYPDHADIRLGAVTSNNDQYLRLRFEVRPKDIGSKKKWVTYAKGGDYSKFYGDIHLLIDWRGNGSHIALSGGQAVRLREIDQYFKPGLTYPLVTVKGMNVRILPSECVFDNGSPSIFVEDEESRLATLAVLNSRIVELYIRCFTSSRHWQVGYVRKIPWPYRPINSNSSELVELARRATTLTREIYRTLEPMVEFIKPRVLFDVEGKSLSDLISNAISRLEAQTNEFRQINRKIDSVTATCYQLTLSELEILDREVPEINASRDQFADISKNPSDLVKEMMNWLVGCAFGRWDIRLAVNECLVPELSPISDSLPVVPPGSLNDEIGSDSLGESAELNPMGSVRNGMLIDDPGHNSDIVARLTRALDFIWPNGKSDDIQSEICGLLNIQGIGQYVSTPGGFFDLHLKQYSQSRRQAPIYWPLSTSSISYTLWIYYPSLNSQTLYAAINDFIEPKLKLVSANAMALRNKGTARDHNDEKQLETLQSFELELIEFRDNLIKVAPNYKPNHDDGVQISAAPLWPHFRHKPWQKVLKETWAKLEKGDCDWAHLAMAYWPERVRAKCKSDKSIAIAHGLEALYVEPTASPKKAKKIKA